MSIYDPFPIRIDLSRRVNNCLRPFSHLINVTLLFMFSMCSVHCQRTKNHFAARNRSIRDVIYWSQSISYYWRWFTANKTSFIFTVSYGLMFKQYNLRHLFWFDACFWRAVFELLIALLETPKPVCDRREEAKWDLKRRTKCNISPTMKKKRSSRRVRRSSNGSSTILLCCRSIDVTHTENPFLENPFSFCSYCFFDTSAWAARYYSRTPGSTLKRTVILN